MNMRFALATLAASFMVAGMAMIVTPDPVSSTPNLANSHAAVHMIDSVRNLTATKNQAWPPAAMITVEPCAIAQCSDA